MRGLLSTTKLVHFLFVLASIFSSYFSSAQTTCSVYTVTNRLPQTTSGFTNVFAWTVKLTGNPSGNGLSHFSLVNLSGCENDLSVVKQAWYSTAADPGPVGGADWVATTIVAGDGSVDVCLPNGTSDRGKVWKFSDVASTIHYAIEFNFNYPVGSGLSLPKYGNDCCTSPIQFPNLCSPTPLCTNPLFDVSKTDVLCNGEKTGSITISNVREGESPYQYSIDGGLNYTTASPIFSNLAAGTYNVRVKENKGGCYTEQTVTINQPSTPFTAYAIKVDVNCYGASTGSIDATVSGGTSPYTYSWSNGTSVVGTTVDVSNLPAGTYTLTVTDSKGCSTTTSATIVQPAAALSASNTKVDVNCYGASTGSIDATVTGGTSPYTYSWSNGTSVVGTTVDVSNLPAGTYTLTVTDSKGCSTTTSATIIQPAAIVTGVVIMNAKCNGESNGSVDLTVSGGTGEFSFLWSNGSTEEDLSGLAAGSYSVTITDANGCIANANAIVGQPLVLSANATKVDVKCFDGSDGSINLTVTGGTAPYTYSWSNGAIIKDISGLVAGSYNVTITDANGCTTTVSTTVGQPSDPLATTVIETKATECAGTKSGSITLSVSGGTSPYKYKLNDGALTDLPENGVISSLYAGDYIVYVQDKNGCNLTLEGKVNVAEGKICYPYYTYSQGYYGNTSGNGVACIKSENVRTDEFMSQALIQGGGLMRIGGSNKSILLGDITGVTNPILIPNQLINLRKLMPAGGSSSNLAGSLDFRKDPTSSALVAKNTGRFNNVLIGQTIAMWFNVNIPGNNLNDSKSFGEFDLLGLECKNTIVTLEPASNSTCAVPFAGTAEVKTAFPQSVVKALIARGNPTINGLMELANEALDGRSKVINGASLSDINGALDAIIRAFHSGKYFARFEGSVTGCTIAPLTSSTTTRNNIASPVETDGSVKLETAKEVVNVITFPNPYVDQVTFNISVKNAGKGSLVLYNAIGQKVANVFEGDMQANSTQTIRYSVPVSQRKSLVYVFRQNGNISTGRLVSGK